MPLQWTCRFFQGALWPTGVGACRKRKICRRRMPQTQPTQHCSAPYRRITGSYVENNFPAKIVVDRIKQVRFPNTNFKRKSLWRFMHTPDSISICCFEAVSANILDVSDVLRPCLQGWSEISPDQTFPQAIVVPWQSFAMPSWHWHVHLWHSLI